MRPFFLGVWLVSVLGDASGCSVTGPRCGGFLGSICNAAEACIELPNEDFCAYSPNPVAECPDGSWQPLCWHGFPSQCEWGYPVSNEYTFTSVGPGEPCASACAAGAEKAFCALSSKPDPLCPDAGYWNNGSEYCSDAGPIACCEGFDVDFDAGDIPCAPPSGNPCVYQSTGEADAESE
jgi:hypothetical protein